MRLSRLLPLAVAATALAACASGGASSGAAPAPAGATRAAAPADWYTYHGSGSRHGYAPTMPPVSGTPKVSKALKLDGEVYASPIVIGGTTVVATENDTVYAFDSSFRQLWKRHLGTPSPASQRPCGNIDPLGITGTPAYAAVTKTIYVAAELSGKPPTHKLYGLSLSSGAVKFGRSLDLPGVDSAAMQERGALLVPNGRSVFVPFGGLAGDCGAYKGRVVRYALSGKGAATVYTVPTSREAGIWTPPGPVRDGDDMLVAVGNGASGVGDKYDYSDSILKLSTALKLKASFSPSTWPTDNDSDLDLGSQGPTTVGDYIFTAGKSGTAYVLKRLHLGGIGGQVSKANICKSFGGTSVVGSVVYVPCTDGLRAVQISSTGTMTVLWHADKSAAGSPVVGGGRVWSLAPGGSTLYALDPATGATKASVSVGSVTRFATPSIYGRTMVVPTTSGITVVTTS